MIYLSQKDPKWADVKLGTGKTTIGSHGCYITCVSMLLGITPPELNKKLIAEHGYFQGNMMISERAANLYNGKYESSNTKPMVFPCIAETNHYAKVGVPQHFFILLQNGMRIDPLDLDPKPERNNYKIVSYRVFTFGENIFKDVPRNHQYAEAIEWAKEKGIVKGYPNGELGVDEKLTMGRLLQVLYNTSKS